MSTRAAIHFGHYVDVENIDRGCHGVPYGDSDFVVVASVYRHSDGYPGDPDDEDSVGLLCDLRDFFESAEKGTNMYGSRFSDPSYLAAKWVVFDSTRWRSNLSKHYEEDSDRSLGNNLDFLGVGVLPAGKDGEPGDIQYHYFVDCPGGGGAKPMVEWEGLLHSSGEAGQFDPNS